MEGTRGIMRLAALALLLLSLVVERLLLAGGARRKRRVTSPVFGGLGGVVWCGVLGEGVRCYIFNGGVVRRRVSIPLTKWCAR
jgi:hypothetical protein